MTEYRKKTDGSLVVGEQSFRQLFPDTSFPKPLTEAIVNDLGYDWILDGTEPTVTPPYESSERDGVEEISGKWYTKYEKTTATGDAKTAIDNNEANRQRGDRNSKLAETDYLALSDATLTDDMKTYRQALRDLPTTSGWPWNPTWPTKPS